MSTVIEPLNPEELAALLLRCQMVLDYKAGKPFTAQNLCALIEAEINADRIEQHDQDPSVR
jgi:hypothetical protein